MPRPRLSLTEYVDGLLAGDRLVLSRAITLIESQLPADRALGRAVLDAVLPHTGRSLRVGITGVPGVGKSTFIEAFGGRYTTAGTKLAVLTVDPSSPRTKGSILGDKTRMDTLSRDPHAFVRPSPAGTSLGGVADRTREALLLCEAAGYGLIFVETVGVGQSETTVRGMVDFFLLLLLSGAGDELQGVKRGIMELADAVLITKADGDTVAAAARARAEVENALHLFTPPESGWRVPVLTGSALTGAGLDELAALLERYGVEMRANGYLLRNRQQQQTAWLHAALDRALRERFYQHPAVRARLDTLEAAVRRGEVLPAQAADDLLKLFGPDPPDS
jgi:LAO/AO transport system kinase